MASPSSSSSTPSPLALCLQPACAQHKWIRTQSAAHIYERPERIRAVLLGAAAAIAHLEESGSEGDAVKQELGLQGDMAEEERTRERERTPDVADLLGNLNISTTTPRKDTPRSESTSSSMDSPYVHVPPVPLNSNGPERLLHTHPALQIIHTPASEHPSPPLPLSSGPATLFPQSEYLRKLTRWALEAPEKIKKGECEIPSSFTLSGPGAGTGGGGTREEETIELNQNDLYLAPGSVEAIEGCVRTVCQAVDLICSPTATATPKYSGAFCTIRPPGHHCGPTTPSGFCYINNLLVSSLHAHQTYSQDRAVIIDFDLHHGNGTQEIVMGLNELGWAEDLLREGGKPERVMTIEEARSGRRGRGWKGFYGSVHDIQSYPCEDGNLDLIKDASVKIAAHGQYIDNVHLDTYTSETDFYDRLYPKYLELLDSAERFLRETEADPERTTVFISAGFDACEHEYDAMQRHGRRVPTSFFFQYTRAIRRFADRHAGGKVISVLEGGYSDKALTSAAMGHVAGFFEEREGSEGWWSEESLGMLEKISRRNRKGGLLPLDGTTPHLTRTRALLERFESHGVSVPSPVSTGSTTATTPRMTLRERTKKEPWTPSRTPIKTVISPPTHLVSPTDQPSTAATPKLRGLEKDPEEVRYSKTLAYLLRHGAEKERLPIRKDGFVRCLDLLNHPKLQPISFSYLSHLVRSNAKQRFTLQYGRDTSSGRPVYPLKKGVKLGQGWVQGEIVAMDAPSVVNEGQGYDPVLEDRFGNEEERLAGVQDGGGGEYFIRAAQGHSIVTVSSDHLERVLDDPEGEGRKRVGELVHGTRSEVWEGIREKGLGRMGRLHVHLAVAREGAKSGPRTNSSLFVYLDFPSLIRDGFHVYVSTNGVVLIPGDEDGFIPTRYFRRVVLVRKEVIPGSVSVVEPVTAGVTGTGEDPMDGNVDVNVPVDEVKTSTSKRGKRGGGVRFWDEVVFEDGKDVEVVRKEGMIRLNL